MFDERIQKILNSLSTREALRVFSALSHEGRFKLLVTVSSANNPTSFSELEKMLKMNPNTLSYHLNTLVNAGLLTNYYSKKKSGRNYSMYKLTERGKTILGGISIDKD